MALADLRTLVEADQGRRFESEYRYPAPGTGAPCTVCLAGATLVHRFNLGQRHALHPLGNLPFADDAAQSDDVNCIALHRARDPRPA